MATLHIDHPITDLETWLAAFASFAPFRAGAGVTAERIGHPVGDERRIVVGLDFATVDEAERFLAFLQSEVWSDPEASPALDGTPTAVVLSPVDVVN